MNSLFTNLNGYLTPISNALILFPLVALFFTLPFFIRQYRKYGGIAFMRLIVVYSLILYMMCAFLLTVLPLPTFEEVRKMPTKNLQLIPFYDLFVACKKSGFTSLHSLKSISAWKLLLKSPSMFQILANIAMQVPLGFYLRYYFKSSWKKTLLIGFCVSLFYETVQFTGLFFIYPHSYRCSDVDDLIANTFGAMIGFWLAPLIMKILPSREDIDRISYDKGKKITIVRRFVSTIIDWLLYCVIIVIMLIIEFYCIYDVSSDTILLSLLISYIVWIIGYFGILQALCKGKTLGKAIVKIQTQKLDGSKATIGSLILKYSIIYFFDVPVVFVGLMLALAFPYIKQSSDVNSTLVIYVVYCVVLIVMLCKILATYYKTKNFPHSAMSKTRITQSSDNTQTVVS